MIDKISVFSVELSLIKDKDIRAFTEKCIEKTPDYFYVVPASSTGKYHPAYSLGIGGLIRHTKALVMIAQMLLSLEYNKKRFSSLEADMIISAGILHDSFKHGDTESQYSIANHPVVAADHILEWAEGDEQEFAKTIVDCVRSHMGEYNTDYRTKKEIMPKPQTDMEMFVHECDYLASRKNIIVQDIAYNPDDYDIIKQIISLCKEKISCGYDRKELLKLIADNNNGNADPRTILKIDDARRILNLIKEI